jgi:CspA family cold shock protein
MMAAPPRVRWLRVIDRSRTDRASEFSFEKRKEVTVATGTIKKVVYDRGFGFITADDAKDYFFHRDALDSSLDFDRLNGGEKVEFDVEQSPKGPRAARVHAA